MYITCVFQDVHISKPTCDVGGEPRRDFVHRLHPSVDGLTLKVTYMPTVVGEGVIDLFWNGYHITGSPFKPLVVEPRMVRPVEGVPDMLLGSMRSTRSRLKESMDWLLPVKEKHSIVFDAIDAGPGTENMLSIL